MYAFLAKVEEKHAAYFEMIDISHIIILYLGFIVAGETSMLAESYIDTVTNGIGRIPEQIEVIVRAAQAVGESALGGNKVFVYDSRGIIDNEMVNRASGLALFRQVTAGRTVISAGDSIIVSSITSEDEASQSIIGEAKAAGAKVVTIAPPGMLSDSADIALLNDMDPDNGVIVLSGVGDPFCPVSGIINATIAWMVVADTVFYIIGQGKQPTVLCGEYIEGGKNKYTEARKRFTAMGY